MQEQHSTRPRRLILLGTLLGILVTSLSASGCSSKSGRSVANGTDSANFAVQNNSGVSLDVYVDNDRLGTVPAGALNSFYVIGGDRTVHLREFGGELIYFGSYRFFNSQILRIDYQPGLRNLTVTNNTGVTVNVLIDGVEVEGVEPQTTSELVVSPGLHDVHFRERGSSVLDFVGLIDFPPAGLTGGVVLTHGP